MENFDIYEYDNDCRYALGKTGKNTIICIGLNPSKATDKEPDPTFTRICKFVENNGYDGFVLLNLCPQCATKPTDVEFDEKLAQENAQKVKKYLEKYPDAKIWCTWGGYVRQKKFKAYFKGIADLLKDRKCACLSKTKTGHPRHPLYVKINTDFECFCIKDYVQIIQN